MSKYVLKNMLKYAKQICKSGGFGVKICLKNMLRYVKQICKPGGFDALSKDYFGCLSPLRFAQIQISKYPISASPISFDAYIWTFHHKYLCLGSKSV